MIFNSEVKESCERIIKYYGDEHQLVQLAEECGELGAAALHYRRNLMGERARGEQELREEIVDVLILIQQMISIGTITEPEIQWLAEYKTRRQERRIQRGEPSE